LLGATALRLVFVIIVVVIVVGLHDRPVVFIGGFLGAAAVHCLHGIRQSSLLFSDFL
jgi:hypothetical protein